MNSVAQDIGTLNLTPDGSVEAGAFGTWTFEFKVGDHGLHAGDTMEIVFFTRFSTNLWSLPQTHDPTAPGFVAASRSDSGFVHVEVYRIPSVFRPHGATMHVVKGTLGGDSLAGGSTLTIVYGDQIGGSPGVQAQFLSREVVFPVFVGTRKPHAQESSKSFIEAMQSVGRPTLAEVTAAAAFAPTIQVVGGRASTLYVSLPSLAQTGSLIPVRLTAMDIHGNRARDYAGCARLYVEPSEADPEPAQVSIKASKGRGAAEVQLPSSDPARIVAVDSEHRLTGTSAPVFVSDRPTERRLFWGEIHVHTIFSDALGRIEEHFECAMNDTCLDFGAISDHDFWLERNPDGWKAIMEKTEEYDRPGRFVTLLGYEIWAMAEGRYSSHANVYFAGSSAQVISRPDIRQVQELCEKEGAIVIPHHTQYGWPNMGTNWDDWAEFTPEQMPAVEIFSTHGLSEYFGCPRSVLWPAKGQSVQDGLARGFRFGIIAGSDYHECLLGHAMDIERYPRTINNRHMQTHTGLVAVYARELTREAIFEAIRRRSVYATSGERIILDFHVNRIPMGGELKLESSEVPRTLNIQVCGTRKLQKIEIIRNGKVAHTERPGTLDAHFTYEDADPVQSGMYYYVRITQASGEQAWSSPIWVDLGR